MKRIASKVSAALKRLTSPYPNNPKVGLFRAALLKSIAEEPRLSETGGTTLAIQSVEDPFYFALFSAIFAQATVHRRIRGELVVVRATSGAIGVGWRARLMRSVPMTWVLSTQWVRAYAGLMNRVAYRSHSWWHPIGDLFDWCRSASIWLRERHQQQDFALRIDGVEVGDLISDTYLRFRPSPMFVASDPFVMRLIWQAHCSVRRARTYFQRQSPAAYLTSYATYVEHGVPVRVALQEGIKVYSFGSLSRFHKRLTLSDWFHTANCDNYRSAFAALPEPDRRIAEAEQQLQTRLSGGIDAATSYMRVSAYANSTEQVPADVRGAVVVFLHDFYDSPHIFPGIVFGDFWSWACHTIDALAAAGIPFFLKPHPNQVQLSSDVISRLRSRFPNVRLLATGITNVQLADAGMACGVTVYGTIAHELAYLGVPTVASARHPHIAFDFCRTARSQEEHAELLRASLSTPVDGQAMRRQALEFYYMHNLFGSAEELELRHHFTALWRACQDQTTNPDDLLAALSKLRQLPAFAQVVQEILEVCTDDNQ